jgi:hypothetical protein
MNDLIPFTEMFGPQMQDNHTQQYDIHSQTINKEVASLAH